ncbi:RHS repeat-associated core domain-containing protein [Prevotella sp. KH2C16]|uniref:RHS repeat-associated core domain-containing protein n=1 Tax=Prevotella sp. KH2C16 TaxID=1855325 RepID=UPI0008F1813B|nr:RHS repeat-associated core domain-containing protein [Prevotella sp. KH2C16]SFG78165.1 RHS repeat-associated core domain-containing protein [Prevotella sp. KH2C16]
MGESQDIASTQRYKYNGKELDRMHGLDWYDYGARHYDATIARWMCVDPLAEKYYHVSPYVYCINNPIRYVDPDGKVVKIFFTGTGMDGNKYPVGATMSYTFDGTIESFINSPNDPFVRDVIMAYSYLKANDASEMFDAAIADPDYVFNLIQTEGFSMSDYTRESIDIYWDNSGGIITDNRGRFKDGRQSPAIQLEHEFTHGVLHVRNPHAQAERRKLSDQQYHNAEEKLVITGHEHDVVMKLGETPRYNHKGTLYKTDGPTTTTPYKGKPVVNPHNNRKRILPIPYISQPDQLRVSSPYRR